MNSPMKQIVFVIEGGEIVEGPIDSFYGFIDTTTTPEGVAPRYHVRGTELWTWGHMGNFPRMLYDHGTAEAAQTALEETFVYDFFSNLHLLAFRTKPEAEQFLLENR